MSNAPKYSLLRATLWARTRRRCSYDETNSDAGDLEHGLLGLPSRVVVGRVRAGNPVQAQINISGDWNFEVSGFGSEAVPCAATIEQTDTTFTIDAECTNFGFGSFEGEIDVETGEFTASGNIGAIPIEIAGTASSDGETIESTWEATSFGFSGTLSAVRKPPGPTPTPLPTLTAPIDTTGTWRISFTGVFSGSCDAVFEQNGEELIVIASCSAFGTLPFQGTLDPQTGEFRLSGLVSLEGQVLAGGDSLTSAWSAFGFGGSLTGERVDDIEIVDFSNEWAMVFLDEVSDMCTLDIEQALILTSAALNCEELGESTLDGAVDPLNGFLWVRGALGDIEIALSGQLSADGSYIFGYDFGADPIVIGSGSGATRTFIAIPAEASKRGVVMVGCQEPGVFEISCSQREQLTMDLAAPMAPSGGYTGIEATLSWSEPLEFGEATPSGQCESAATVSSEVSVSLTCSFAEQSDFTGDLVSVTLTCDERANTVLEIGSASFQGADPDLGPPTLINSTISCFGPQRGGPAPLLGDVDCSSEVNSIDAALVLQFDAGLLGEAPCESQADVNLDGFINSIDATLILQLDAGLLDRLPVL